ncbi:MAG: hypothetical protein ACRDHW_13010, partial [Ktedonobacteraceae bacterium]
TALIQGQPFGLLPEEFLPQCAASLTACWHLLRGQEFLLVEKVLTRYLPTLADLAHQPSIRQQEAASLATQGYRIIGIVAQHQTKTAARDIYYQQAVQYAEIAGKPGLLAAALISRAYYHKNPSKTLPLYQRGLLLQEELSPLLLSRLYARLAVVSAQQDEEQDALRYLNLAKERYPEHPETDPGFLYAEFSPASLIMEEGFMYLSLTQQGKTEYAEQAWETFAQVEQWPSSIPVPARIQVEIVNHQTRTSLAMNDLERFCSYLEQGVNGAKFLHSGQRMQEALNNYKLARSQWPSETRVQSLAESFL